MSDEPDVSRLMTVAEAVAAIDAEPVEPRVNIWPLRWIEGRRLTGDVATTRDHPFFDKSLMDGFAVRAADTRDGEYDLRVIGEVAAGAAASRPLGPGEAVSIMTGAPLPPGADAVVPIEWSSRSPVVADRVRLIGRAEPGRHVAARGSDRPAGYVIARAGRRLRPTDVGALASAGIGRVPVIKAVSTAIITTGDEIVAAGREAGPTQVYDANRPMLKALLSRLGTRDVEMARTDEELHAVDDPQVVCDRIEGCLYAADVLFVTGGMSMGAYDFVPRVLADLGFESRVTKLKIKPGKPFVFAVLPGERTPDGRPRYAFGLPGNPVSAFVCTLVLASRLIARLGGGPADEFCRERLGLLDGDVPANGPRQFYQPCRVDDGPVGRVVTPLAWRGSADVFTLADADGLIVRPADDPPRPAGAAVHFLEIPR